MTIPLDDRVATVEKDVAALRDEANRYRSDIAVRDELYARTGAALLSFLHMVAAQLTAYRDAILRDGTDLPPAALAAFDTFATALIAELGVMCEQYETVFSTVAQIIGGG